MNINQFIYQRTIRECRYKSNEWIQRAANDVLFDLADYIKKYNKVPELEKLDQIESILCAFKDELVTRESRGN